MVIMTDPHVAYFFKKYYGNIIKWYFVSYSAERRVISFSEEDAAYSEQLAKEKDHKLKERVRKYCEAFGLPIPEEFKEQEDLECNNSAMDSSEMLSEDNPDITSDDGYNATTGSYSGLYGQKPVDAGTQSMLDEIMGKTGSQNSVDSILSGGATNLAEEPAFESDSAIQEDVTLSPEDEDLVKEANEIFERLMREAAEDEAKKQAEIEEAKRQAGA